MQINTVIMAGRLVDDVEYKSTKNGTPLSTFKLANDRGQRVNYFRVASFGKVADYAHKYLRKSERVTVQGELNHHEVKDKDGWHDYYTIIASTFDPIHRKSQSKSTRELYSRLDDVTKKLNKVSSEVGGKRKVATK